MRSLYNIFNVFKSKGGSKPNPEETRDQEEIDILEVSGPLPGERENVRRIIHYRKNSDGKREPYFGVRVVIGSIPAANSGLYYEKTS